LPEIPDRIVATLAWSAVPGAVGYRIYRSPAADAGSNREEWLADVSGPTTTTYTDVGLGTDPSLRPLPKGALGEWAALPPLPSPLRSPCVTAATDPVDPSVSYLYVAGGLDDGNRATDAVQLLDLTAIDEHTQSVGSWVPASATLGAASFECGAWTVDGAAHSVVGAGESWVYFGGGRTNPANSSTTGSVIAGRVLAGGDLGSVTSVEVMNPSRAGFGVASASNFLYAFGGQGARPSNGGKSSEILVTPTLENWNDLGTRMSESRYLMGSAQESAVIFMVGGETSGAAASASVDWANY
jgi:hypothetical protein